MSNERNCGTLAPRNINNPVQNDLEGGQNENQIRDYKVEINKKTRMNRNPLTRDGGCNFIFCVGLQFLLQLLFYFHFVKVGFYEDGLHEVVVDRASYSGY